MAKKRRAPTPTTQSIASYVKRHATRVKQSQMRHHAATETIREADHRGHHIVVKTRYEISVDGRKVLGHLGVSNDGHVHYHPIPNLSFASALDMVKAIIDVFPHQFDAKKRSDKGPGRIHHSNRKHH